MLTRIIGVIVAVALPMAASATEYQTVGHPRQECWNEQVPVQSAGSGLGPLIGGIAGGIIGNQVGHGGGKAAATAVGVVTGAVVGDRLSASAPQYQTVQRCRTVVDEERVPVYRQPPTVYYAPQPVTVIEQPAYYIQPDGPYYDSERWDNGRHRGWRHHRHHHDDDDD